VKAKSQERLLAERSVKAATQGSGSYRRGICFPCILRTGKPDRRGCFSYNASNGWFQCFKCGLRGRMDGFEDIVFEEEPERPVMRAPEGFYELTRGEGVGSLSLEPAVDYLRSRGLKDKRIWSEAHLGACVSGFFANRVVVPVLSPDEDWLGFVARAWTKKADVPYLYPEGMQRAEILYNHAALLVETDEPVYVVEGVMDTLALWPHSVALLGKPSDPQVWALADAERPVVVVLDGDAWREGDALALRLKLEGQRAGSVRLPAKLDPDEVPRDWLVEEGRRALE
jgi:hypothetical protein